MVDLEQVIDESPPAEGIKSESPKRSRGLRVRCRVLFDAFRSLGHACIVDARKKSYSSLAKYPLC